MDKAEVIAEIRELISDQLIGPLDITIAELIDQLHIGRHAVISRMNRLVAQGLYGKGKKIDSETRREQTVYWKVEDGS